jgi:transcriptional regulator GlxA family with amidase domain
MVGGSTLKMDRRVLYLRNLFWRDLSYRWTAREMAERVNLSVSHLNRVFKADTGLSPMLYLREMRLEKAARLLENSFLSVKEIRVQTGLRDKSLFIKDFKKKYGTAPTAYRARAGQTSAPEESAEP